MNTRLDNRAILVNLVKHMDGPDMKQMLAYAAGYEAGKINLIYPCPADQTQKQPKIETT